MNDAQHSGIHQIAAAVQELQGAFLDAYVVVNTEGSVVAFNRLFYSMFPRRVARNLKGVALFGVLELKLNDAPLDPIAQCLERKNPVRFDEVEATIAGPEPSETLKLIVAATPLGEGVGVLLVLRDVTDEAQVQTKYKHMLKEEADAKAQLEDVLRRRTSELLAANDKLNSMQVELTRYKKGLLLS